MARIDGVALGAAAAGGLFVYAGITGRNIPAALQAIVTGKSPATVPKSQQIQSSASSSSSGGAGGVGPAPTAAGGYSVTQLKSLWIMAGGSPATADTAACIASHESSGEPSVTSSNPDGGTNVGLWQLDTPGGKGAGYSVAQLQNPLTNARVAIAGSSDGRDWSAWATAPLCGV